MAASWGLSRGGVDADADDSAVAARKREGDIVDMMEYGAECNEMETIYRRPREEESQEHVTG